MDRAASWQLIPFVRRRMRHGCDNNGRHAGRLARVALGASALTLAGAAATAATRGWTARGTTARTLRRNKLDIGRGGGNGEGKAWILHAARTELEPSLRWDKLYGGATKFKQTR